MAVIYPSLADPVDPSPLVGAVAWLEGTLLGALATSVAVIAVAVVGFMMLTGRLQVRRGVTVVLGCFILFGAPVLADGIRSVTEVIAAPPPPPIPIATISPDRAAPPTIILPPMPPSPAPAYDPYAGASVRPR